MSKLNLFLIVIAVILIIIFILYYSLRPKKPETFEMDSLSLAKPKVTGKDALKLLAFL